MQPIEPPGHSSPSNTQFMLFCACTLFSKPEIELNIRRTNGRANQKKKIAFQI
jgi:hypothetical protein